MFLSVQLILSQFSSGNILAPNRWQTIIWTDEDLCIYASLGLNEFSQMLADAKPSYLENKTHRTFFCL